MITKEEDVINAIKKGYWFTIKEAITEVRTDFFRHVFSCCGRATEWYTESRLPTLFIAKIEDGEVKLTPGCDVFFDNKHIADICIVVPFKHFCAILNEDRIDETPKDQPSDMVNHPSHYAWLKDLCGVEPIDICRHFDFAVGNALKYLMRKGKKDGDMTDKEKRLEDLRKAVFYLNDEIALLGGENGTK